MVVAGLVMLGVFAVSAMNVQAGGDHLPDFRVESIKVATKHFYCGDTVRIEVKVKNRGRASGDAGWVQVYSGGQYYYAYVGHLKKGKSRTVRLSHVATDWHSPARVEAIADAYGWTYESNEHNNSRTCSFRCRSH